MKNKITKDKIASNRWHQYTNQYKALHYARENRQIINKNRNCNK